MLLVLAAGILLGLYLTGRIWTPDEDAEPPVRIYSLGEFITNLSGDAGHRFIRVRIDVEVVGHRAQRELDEKRSVIRNRILAVLRSCHYEEVEDDVGMELLAERLEKGINTVLDATTVTRVLVVEMVIQ